MRKDKEIVIFDLDETIINSTHRIPNKPDGTLDLVRYFELKTRENVFKDTLLPLADLMRDMYASGKYHVIICTARHMNEDDYDFLEENDLKFHEIFERGNVRKAHHYDLPDAEYKTKMLKKYKNTPYTFYDDATPIISTFSTYPNVKMVDATAANSVLSVA
jgi:FMN phosphatase YigB (HAD superfamily)